MVAKRKSILVFLFFLILSTGCGNSTTSSGNATAGDSNNVVSKDVVAPDTVIITYPDKFTNLITAEFSFSSTETGSTFSCNLDNSGWENCSSPEKYTGLSNGVHFFSVKSKDIAGNEDSTPANYEWEIDIVAPDTFIEEFPITSTVSTDAVFIFSSNEQNSIFKCKLDGNSWESCVSPQKYSGLSLGPHIFEVKAEDRAGNEDQSSAIYSWNIASSIIVAIDSTPNSLSSVSNAEFTFSASETSCIFQCKLDDTLWEDCNSPKNYTGLLDGIHIFSVKAKGNSDNYYSLPARYSWTIDTVEPETTINSYPNNLTNSLSAIFVFSSNESGTFECSIDGSSWGNCTSSKSYNGLSEGSHTFEVRAIDNVGNVDSTPASYTWSVDTTAPETTINSFPDDPTNSTTVTFEFSSNESNAIFKCKIDSGSWVNCTSPKTYSNLAEGTHTFKVKAIDNIGNEDSTYPEYIWIIDITAPNTMLNSYPASRTSSQTATFTFSSSEGKSTFECNLDYSNWINCSSPNIYSGLSEGNHHFEVRATDQAGNTDPTSIGFSWLIDITSPETTIDKHPSSFTNSTTAQFDFSSNEVDSSFKCRLDSGSWDSCSSTKIYSNLSDGSHIFEVYAVDYVGNEDSTPVSYTWTVDTVAPETTIDSSPSEITSSTIAVFIFSSGETETTFECKLDTNLWTVCSDTITYTGLSEGSHTFEVKGTDKSGNTDSTPASYTWTVDTIASETTIDSYPLDPTNSSTAVFVFSSNETATFECNLDSGSWSNCTSPQTYTSQPDGSHTFEVRATDKAGNTDSTPASYTWTVDTTAPETTIDSYPLDPTNSSTAVFVFSSNETATFECNLDSGLWSNCTSPQTYTSQIDGSHTFEVRATDNAGNVDSTPANYTWSIDTTAPETVFDSYPLDPTNSSIVTFTFFSNEGEVTYLCSFNSSSWESCSSPATYTTYIEGSNSLYIKTTDKVGNYSTTDYSWVFDKTPPESTITDYPDTPTYESNAVFQFISNETNSTFRCRLDYSTWEDCSSPVEYTELDTGTHYFEVEAIDQASNVETYSSLVSWVIAKTWKYVSSGYNNTCGIYTNNHLYCWGYNNYGQLGIGNNVKQISPTLVGNGTWESVDISNHTCGIKTDGTLWCWGNNGNGQLGIGNTTSMNVPSQVGNETDWNSVTIGDYHTCAIKDDGSLYCWGKNDYGQLGLGDGADSQYETPQTVGSDLDWSIIQAGGSYTCGIKTNGSLYCWGRNNYGQLGVGDTLSYPYPNTVGSDSDWAKLTLGAMHTCSIKNNGKLYCWGDNSLGQIGIENVTRELTPTLVNNSTEWDLISAGVYWTCGTNSDSLMCWGDNSRRQLAMESAIDKVSTPVTVATVNLLALSGGYLHNCAIADDEVIYCLGDNYYGELGVGEDEYFIQSQEISFSGNVTSVSNGESHSCLIDTNLNLYCWGDNRKGELGIGNQLKDFYNIPQVVNNLYLWSQVSLGYDFSCGIQTDSSLWCWGVGYFGSLGLGNYNTQLIPNKVGTDLWQDISTGRKHSCGIKSNGDLNCWGDNLYKQVGTDTATKYNTPQTITSFSDWISVGSDGYISCGIRNSGSLYCWGRNNSGQLGLGFTSTSELPTLVSTGWFLVEPGDGYACGIKYDGTLWCWGYNGWGSLGTGNYTTVSTPEQVGSDTDWIKVSAGNQHSCAVKSDNSLYCWGKNSFGELGINSTNSFNSPQQVEGNWTDVTCGYNYTCAINVSGKEYCWGDNYYANIALDEHPWRIFPQLVEP